MNWNEIWTSILNWVMNTGIRIVIALVVMFIAFKIINAVARKLEKKNEKKGKLDKTIARTLICVGKVALKIIVTVCLIGYLGIDTSGITALIASLGVCVGLAVNGALSNIAGGVLLLITRPFRVDDYIDIAGYSGVVEDIHICNTKIRTLDNKVIYVPNGVASTSCVVNYSEKELRRVDLEFEISEEENFDEAKKILMNVISSHAKIIQDMEKTVRVCNATDNGVVICCRSWCKNEDYWDVFFDVREEAKRGFDKANIEFPYEQLDVRVIDKREREKR